MKKQDIKELMNFFNSLSIKKMKLKQDDVEIELEKNTDANEITNPISQEEYSPCDEKESYVKDPKYNKTKNTSQVVIKSPMVGTFYQAPAPGAKPFVKVGSTVNKGESVAIIEAMKIMNEIESEFDCKIKKILVSDGQPVEFDMPLFEVEKL